MSADDTCYLVEFCSIDYFKQSEVVNVEAARQLAQSITFSEVWTTVLPVEKMTGYVMDGNHRLAAAKLLGLRMLPCVQLDYFDQRVSVSRWDSNEIYDRLTLDQCAKIGRVLPHKSTRHQFDPALPLVEIAVSLLKNDI